MPLWRRILNHVVPHRENAYRPHFLRRGWVVFFLALVLATEGFLVASLVARQAGGSFLASVIASEIVNYTNDARTGARVVALRDSTLLDKSAQAKADDMAQKGYFAHQSPDGRSPWDFIIAAGYDYQYAGENLAVRFVDSKDVVDAWLQSPSHRSNIVKPVYRDIGVGIAQGMYKGSPATFVVQHFGTAATRVLGTEVGPTPTSMFDSAYRQATKFVSDPRESAGWILGGVAALLLLLVALAFIFHIQVQALDLLLPGAVVAAVAIFFLAFNGLLLGVGGGAQTAAVAGVEPGAVVVSHEAAFTQR